MNLLFLCWCTSQHSLLAKHWQRNSLKALNLNISIDGSGKVISQDILAGQEVEEGTVVTVTLKDEMVGGAQ